MTQTEQNKPVRTRDEQVSILLQEFGGAFYGNGLRYMTNMKATDLLRAIAEAEARGAAEQRRKDAEGYLFDNPDTGTEYLPYHPIESGECQYAENIRKATNSELLSELNAAWTGWEEDRGEKAVLTNDVASLEARIAELEGALGQVVATGPDYFSPSGHIVCVDIARAALTREEQNNA